MLSQGAKQENVGLGLEGASDEEILKIESQKGRLDDAALKLQQAALIIKPGPSLAHPLITAAFTKISGRSKEIHAKIEKAKADAKEQLEKRLGESYVAECTAKTKEAETSLHKIEEVEKPYITGVEALTFDESQKSKETANEAMAFCTNLIGSVMALISSRSSMLESFDCKNAKDAMGKLGELSDRISTKDGSINCPTQTCLGSLGHSCEKPENVHVQKVS